MNKTINEIRNSIVTLEDVYRINGISEQDAKPFKNPTNKDQISTNADFIIKQITKAYNQDTILDWNNINQPKYYCYWRKVLAHGGGWSLLWSLTSATMPSWGPDITSLKGYWRKMLLRNLNKYGSIIYLNNSLILSSYMLRIAVQLRR